MSDDEFTDEPDNPFSEIPHRRGSIYFLTAEEEQRFDKIGDGDFVDEAQWVHQNSSNMRIKAIDAPSRGAWNIYCEIKRRERRKAGSGYDWFYKHIMPPVMRELNRRKERENAESSEYALSGQEKKGIGEIREMLALAAADSKQWGDGDG